MRACGAPRRALTAAQRAADAIRDAASRPGKNEFAAWCARLRLGSCAARADDRRRLTERHALPELKMRQLSSFIILPVQRVCKYPLLLKELIKVTLFALLRAAPNAFRVSQRTSSEHVDAAPLAQASLAVGALVKAVNERTKDIENQIKIAELQSKCAGLDKVRRLASRRVALNGGGAVQSAALGARRPAL